MTSRMLVVGLTGAVVAVMWASSAEGGTNTAPAVRTAAGPSRSPEVSRTPTASSAEKDLVRPRSTSARGHRSASAASTRPPARPTARPTALAPSSTTKKAPPATRQGGTKTPAAPSKAKPRPAPPPAPAPPRRSSGPTGWAALDAAIARIPGYSPGGIRWSVTPRYGHWGATDLATSEIFISPAVSPGLLDSVVRHEYAHVVTVRAYGGDWRAAKSGTNAAFGGSGRTGVELAADCMARAMGASWTQYTSCARQDWQQLSARLLSGRRL